MKDYTTKVTLTGLQVRATSRSRHSAGQTLNFLMLHKVQVGTAAPLTFRPPRRDEVTVLSTAPKDQTYIWSEWTAKRLEQFVRTCFAGSRTPKYSSFYLLNFLSGLTRKPTDTLPGGCNYGSTGRQIPAGLIRQEWGYVLMSGAQTPRLGAIGLGPNLVLAVLGTNGMFGVCEALPLVKLYACDGIAEVHGITKR